MNNGQLILWIELINCPLNFNYRSYRDDIAYSNMALDVVMTLLSNNGDLSQTQVSFFISYTQY